MMNYIELLTAVIGIVLLLFLVLFTIASVRERKYRAAAIGMVFLLVTGTIWFGGIFVYQPGDAVLTAVFIIIIVLVLLFFLPVGKTTVQEVAPTTDKADERDVMFARNEYLIGSERYETYYRMRPEKKAIDDKLRTLPQMCEPGGVYYDRFRTVFAKAAFKLEEHLVDRVDGPINPWKEKTDPESITAFIKKTVLHFGADDVGIARLNPNYVYSHVGKGPEEWGSEINNTHPYVIAFALEMRYDRVDEAPNVGAMEETALQYLNGQRVSISLAQFIRDLGYSARAHVSGSNYQIMLPPVGYDAGLGELGRLGYLISPRFGARFRLGAVTTDLPLITDKPISFGVQDFCETCKKCAENCPSKAIPMGSKTDVRGVRKWQLHIEKCYWYWRYLGTDCGLCMKVCPFSHPDALVHNVLRAGIKRSSFARKVSDWGDDLFYGKTVDYPKFKHNSKNWVD